MNIYNTNNVHVIRVYYIQLIELQAGHPFFTRTTKGPFADIIPSKSKYSAPTFTIFLDCVWQVRLFC